MRSTASVNALARKKQLQKVKTLQRKKDKLGNWIAKNVAHPQWEEKVREYNALCSQILAIEGKTKYIIIHK